MLPLSPLLPTLRGLRRELGAPGRVTLGLRSRTLPCPMVTWAGNQGEGPWPDWTLLWVGQIGERGKGNGMAKGMPRRTPSHLPPFVASKLVMGGVPDETRILSGEGKYLPFSPAE